MATNSDWKLKFNSEKWSVVLPPEGLEKVNRTIGEGPNSQQIEHCHYASSMEELLRRAPIFFMRVPICDKGETRDWPMGDWPKCEVGQHSKVGLPIAVFQSRRVDEYEFDLKGLIKTDIEHNSFEVAVYNYSVQSREGRIVMSGGTYRAVVSLWQRHFYETK